MEGHEEEAHEAEKKELRDLIGKIVKEGLQTMKDEIIDTGAYNREAIEKKIAEVYERQSNISANQQILLDKMVELQEGKPKKEEKTD